MMRNQEAWNSIYIAIIRNCLEGEDGANMAGYIFVQT